MKIRKDFSVTTATNVPVKLLNEVLDFIENQDYVTKIYGVFTGDDKYKLLKCYRYEFRNKRSININIEMCFDIDAFKSYEKHIDYKGYEDRELKEIFSDEMYELFNCLKLDIKNKFNLDALRT